MACRAGAADRASGLRGRRRRGGRDRRPLCDRRRRRGAARRLRRRQRIFRPRHGAAELPLSRAFEAAAVVVRPGALRRGVAGRGEGKRAHPARRHGGLARRASFRRGRICATRSPTSSSITSSIAGFRRPGDVHVYYYGASALSCAAGFATKPGDVFEVDVPVFGRPLRNPLVAGKPDRLISVASL